MSCNFLLRNQSIHFLKSFYLIFLRSELLLLEDNSLLQFACAILSSVGVSWLVSVKFHNT